METQTKTKFCCHFVIKGRKREKLLTVLLNIYQLWGLFQILITNLPCSIKSLSSCNKKKFLT